MTNKLHWMLVGTVTDKAKLEIEEIGGIVHPIEQQLFPLLTAVGLPYPQFEMQEFNEVRIRAGGKSFVWRGHHPGPEWTNCADTTLRCEYGEPTPDESGSAEALDLDDFETFNEHLGEPHPEGEPF
jgi:hypothetical protein